MPELPDVEGFRRVISEHASGHRVDSISVRDPQVLREVSVDEFSRSVHGRYLSGPRRYGKWLVIPTGSTASADPEAPFLVVHFGMTGMLVWCGQDEPEHKHDRVVLRMSTAELRYRDMRKLKGLRLAQSESEVDDIRADLGPDAFSVSGKRFERDLNHTKRRMKHALLDQRVVAGLGNLCVDEILWRARVNPRQFTTDVSSDGYRVLYRRMRSVLRESARVGRVPAYPSWLTGHREALDQCPRCSTRLQQDRRGGRGSVWCPRCQPEVTP